MTYDELKAIGFANGDKGIARGADLVLGTIFKRFPTINVPLSIEERLRTKDGCIEATVAAFLKCGSGFKNSTAANDPRLIHAGLKSLNKKMRPKLGAYAMLRLIMGPGGAYDKISGVLRYASGGIYDEQSCTIEIINGIETAVTVNHMNLVNLKPYAELAIRKAKEHNLTLTLMNKKTICETQKLFNDRVEAVWNAAGMKLDEDYFYDLTDTGTARIPITTAQFGHNPGGFLICADNEAGDTASDVLDFQNGKQLVGSEVYCLVNGEEFTYQELSSGTVDKCETGRLVGDRFLNPTALIFQIAAAFEKVNPDEKEFFDAVRTETLAYLEPDNYEKDTEYMLGVITKKTEHLLLAAA